MLRKTIYLLTGTSMAKLIPIVAGYIVSMQLGSESYGFLITFFLFSNVISNFSILGCSPQIISLDNQHHLAKLKYLRVICVGLFFLVCASLIGSILTSFDLIKIKSSIIHFLFPSIVYSIGMFFVYTSTSRLNNMLENNLASLVWLLYSLLSMLVIALFGVLYMNLIPLFYSIAVSSLITGFFGVYLSLQKHNSYSDFDCVYIFNLLDMKNVIIKAILLSFFGISIVGCFFYLQNGLLAIDDDQGAYFSLLYQVFAFTIFIPTVIGNILVPRMLGNSRPKMSIYIYYMLITSVIVFPILIYNTELANLYGIDAKVISFNDIVVFYLLSIIAGINSYSTQVLVASMDFVLLAASSLIWVVVTVTYLNIYGFDLSNVLNGLLLSYTVSGVLLIGYIFNRGNELDE